MWANTQRRQGRDKIKANLNIYGSVEKKGKEVSDPFRMTANYIFCGNDPKQFDLEADDRRFSVPDITTEPLLNDGKKLNGPFTDGQIYTLIDKLETDLEFQRQFGWYVLSNWNHKEYDNIVPLRDTETYDILVETTMADWQRSLLRIMYDSPFIYLGELRSQEELHGVTYSTATSDRNRPGSSIFLHIFLDWEALLMII